MHFFFTSFCILIKKKNGSHWSSALYWQYPLICCKTIKQVVLYQHCSVCMYVCIYIYIYIFFFFFFWEIRNKNNIYRFWLQKACHENSLLDFRISLFLTGTWTILQTAIWEYKQVVYHSHQPTQFQEGDRRLQTMWEDGTVWWFVLHFTIQVILY